MRNSDQRPIETIKLNSRAQRELVQQVRGNGQPSAGEERRSLRVGFDVPYVDLVVHPNTPIASPSRFRVMPVDLSSGGLAFAHGRYIHLDSRCEVFLPQLDEQVAIVQARVLTCAHLKGMIHRVAVKFDDIVDLSQFVALTGSQTSVLQQQRQEGRLSADNPLKARLQGKVLVIDDGEADRELFSFWLRKTGLTPVTAMDGDAAVKLLPGVDMVLCDCMLGEADGRDVARAIRTAGFHGPMLMVTADEREQTHKEAIAAGCDEVLVKPLKREQLLRAVARRLRLAQGELGGRIASSFARDTEWWPVLRKFVAALGSHADALAQAVQAGDVAQLQALCHQIKGAGGSYGFPMLSETAGRVMDALMDSTQEVAATMQSVNGLIEMLRRAESP